MIDLAALWVGYAVLVVGGGLLAAVLFGLAIWQVVEWYYRRFIDFGLLREFLRWKRNGWSPDPKEHSPSEPSS